MPIQLRRTSLSTFDEGGLRAPDQPRLNPNAVGAPYGAVAQGASKIADVVSALATVDQEKRKLEDHSAALRLVTNAQKEFQNRLSVLNQAPDHNTYALAVDKVIADVTAEFGSRAGNNASVMRLYADTMAKFGVEEYAKARATQDKLFAQYHTGVLAETLVEKKHRIAETMRTRGPLAALEEVEEGAAVIDRYETLFGRGAMVKQREAWTQSTANMLAYQAAKDSPEAFIGRPGARGLVALFEGKADEKYLIELTEAAKSRAERLTNDARTRARAAMEARHKDETEAFESMLDKRAREGTLDEGAIQAGLDLRYLTSEKAQALRDRMEKRAVQGGTGNPSVIQRLDTAIYTTSPSGLRALQTEIMATPLDQYPLAHRTKALNYIDEKIAAFEKAQTDLGKSKADDLMKRDEKARAAFKRALTVSGNAARMLQSAEIEANRAALELLDRNFAAGFPEDPMAIYFSRRHEFIARLGMAGHTAVHESYRALRATGYANPEDPSARRVEFQKKSFPSEAAKLEEARRLMELEELEGWTRKFSAPKGGSGATNPTPKSGANAPASGYTPPVPGPRRQ